MSFNPTGYGSAVVNGQLLPQLPAQGIFPPAPIAPYLRSVIGTPPPTIGGATGNSGNAAATQAAAANPLSFIKSPVPLLLIMLVVGVAGLRYIHWA